MLWKYVSRQLLLLTDGNNFSRGIINSQGRDETPELFASRKRTSVRSCLHHTFTIMFVQRWVSTFIHLFWLKPFLFLVWFVPLCHNSSLPSFHEKQWLGDRIMNSLIMVLYHILYKYILVIMTKINTPVFLFDIRLAWKKKKRWIFFILHLY